MSSFSSFSLDQKNKIKENINKVQSSVLQYQQKQQSEIILNLVLVQCKQTIERASTKFSTFSQPATAVLFCIPNCVGTSNEYVILDPISIRDQLIRELIKKDYRVEIMGNDKNTSTKLFISWTPLSAEESSIEVMLRGGSHSTLLERRDEQNLFVNSYRLHQPIYKDKTILSLFGPDVVDDENRGTNSIIKAHLKGLKRWNKLI